MDRTEKPTNLVKIEKFTRKLLLNEKFHSPEQAFELLAEVLKKHPDQRFAEKNADIKKAYLDANISDDGVKDVLYASSMSSASALALGNMNAVARDLPKRSYSIEVSTLETASRKTPNFEKNLLAQVQINALSKSLEQIYLSILRNGTISHSKLTSNLQDALETKVSITAKSDIPREVGSLNAFNHNESRAITEGLQAAIEPVKIKYVVR